MEVGTPDLIGCICPHGLTICIETKIRYNKPTKIQLLRLEQWSRAGAIAFWTNSMSDYLDKLRAELERRGMRLP